MISPTIVNEVSVSARHGSEGFIPSDGEIDRLTRSALNYTAPQLFSGNNKLGTIPRATSWGGLSQTTVANINWLDRWGEIGQDYILPSISDNLTINHRNHNYKAGFYLERIRNGEAPGGQWSGAFNFSSNDANFSAAQGNTGHPYANALTGGFRSYSESSSRPHTDLERCPCSMVRAGSVESPPALDAELRGPDGLVLTVDAAPPRRFELRPDALRSGKGAVALSPLLRRWNAGYGRLRQRQPARPEPDYR